MAFLVENLILESFTGTLAASANAPLGNPLLGYFGFSDKYANGDTCHYLIRGVDVVGRPTGQIEIGRGTVIVASGVYSLRRDTIFRSTNAGAAVAFIAGTKFVSVSSVAPANDDIRADLQASLGLDVAGQIAFFAGSTPPPGWLKANGAAISRTTYLRLFARIGTTYGVGDGTSTFNLPDARGEFLRAWDDGRALDNGRALGSVQAGMILSHGHTVNDPGHAHGVYDPGHSHSAYTDSQGAHNHNYTIGTYGTGGAGAAALQTALATTQTDVQGSHSHNVGVYGAGTGIGIYSAGTGLSVAANGGTENRPRNLAVACFIKF